MEYTDIGTGLYVEFDGETSLENDLVEARFHELATLIKISRGLQK